MMEPADDASLLQEYAQGRSEQAFETLLRRHLDLVYSAAFRQMGNPHAADDVTQATFILLARKAGRLGPGVFLPSWLLKTVRFAAASHRRAAYRREHYEMEAHVESIIRQEGAPEPAWTELAPILDEAVASLKETDRQAVLLRFYQSKRLKEIGDSLGIDEDTAQKRVTRAIQRLRSFFVKKGLPISSASLAALLSANAVQAAPPGLATSLAAAALTQTAVSTGILATVIQGASRMMLYTQIKTAAAIGTSLVLAGAFFLAVRAPRSSDTEVWTQVIRLVATNQWNEFQEEAGMAPLVALGPRALPALGELLEWQPEIWHRQAEQHADSLPKALQPYLRDLELRRELQRKAAQIIAQIGPAAARPLTSRLCDALSEPAFKSDYHLLRALAWALPESPRAVGALSNYLADPSGGFTLFATIDADALWPRLPQFAPMLIAWLSNLSAVNDAARALGTLGTNAHAALPALIDVSENGVAGTPLALEGSITYSAPWEPYLGNQRAALAALGQIGIASPEVVNALKKGVEDESVRLAALKGLVALGPPVEIELVKLLESVALPRSFGTQGLVREIGQLGPRGRWALPWLERFTSVPFLEALTAPPRDSRDAPVSAAELRLTAIVATCQIRPADLPKYIPTLATPTSVWAFNALSSSAKENASAVEAAVAPFLDSPESWARVVAAEVLLNVVPSHARARSLLQGLAKNGTLAERIHALGLLSKTSRGTADRLSLIREALKQEDADAAQAAIQQLVELGSAGRSAIPDLKAALWHKDWRVRIPAGHALRSLAPEELPPVR